MLLLNLVWFLSSTVFSGARMKTMRTVYPCNSSFSVRLLVCTTEDAVPSRINDSPLFIAWGKMSSLSCLVALIIALANLLRPSAVAFFWSRVNPSAKERSSMMSSILYTTYPAVSVLLRYVLFPAQGDPAIIIAFTLVTTDELFRGHYRQVCGA